MSEIDKEKDIDQLMYRELPPDRYCYIHNYIIDLKSQLQQKENIIKEAINYIKEESWYCYKDGEEAIDRTPVEKLLEILGDKNEI